MKLTPIVALVTDEALAAIDEMAAKFPGALTDQMRSNGWTIEALAAGAALSAWVSADDKEHA